MKRCFVMAASLTCLIWALSYAKTKEISPSDFAKINEVTSAFAKAILARDWAAVGGQYTEDAVLYAPNMPVAHGRAAVQQSMSTFPPVTEFRLNNTKVDGRDDLAYVTGTYSMTIPVPEGAAPIHATGNYVEIRRKQADGRWLISVDIYNSDQPLPPPPPATAVQKK